MRQLKIQQKISLRDSESVTKFFTEVSQIPLLSKEEEIDLAKRIEQGDMVAREKLIKSNLRFVISVAKTYQTTGLMLSDLINEGNLGLMEAVDRFDYRRGYKFISYAVWWIRQNIIQYIENNGRIIRMPNNRSNLMIKINKYVDSSIKEKGYPPEPSEICEKFYIDYITYINMMECSLHHNSLDKNIKEGETTKLSDVIQSSFFNDPDHDVIIEGRNDRIYRMLSKIPERDAEILKLSFGIGENDPWTLEAISERMDITRERVRQIKERALKNLRIKLSKTKNPSFYIK